MPAAGMGRRLGYECPKALVPIGSRPMLIETLLRFDALDLLDGAVVVVPPENRDQFRAALDAHLPGRAVRLVDGGEERQQSVENGLAALDADTDIVAIHDAARPFVQAESIRASIAAAAEVGAATVAVPSVDTILVADADMNLSDTPDRSRLWACQTPQTFRVAVIREAHRLARQQGLAVTDDATLVHRTIGAARIVMGSPLNFKVTTPEDLALARLVLEKGLA